MTQLPLITDSQLGILLQLCASPHGTCIAVTDPDIDPLLRLGLLAIQGRSVRLTNNGLAHLQTLIDLRSGPIQRHIRTTTIQ